MTTLSKRFLVPSQNEAEPLCTSYTMNLFHTNYSYPAKAHDDVLVAILLFNISYLCQVLWLVSWVVRFRKIATLLFPFYATLYFHLVLPDISHFSSMVWTFISPLYLR